jgi:hypothetical protein
MRKIVLHEVKISKTPITDKISFGTAIIEMGEQNLTGYFELTSLLISSSQDATFFE